MGRKGPPVVELISVLAVVAAAATAGIGWRLFRKVDRKRDGDARSLVIPAPDGTIRVVVTNPGPEPVVVTACARPAGRLRWQGRSEVRRRRSPKERRDAWRASRQILGSVPSGGRATWTVVDDTRSRPLCRVVLSLYQTAGRVRVHEATVRTEPPVGLQLGWRDRLRPAPAVR